MEKGRLNILVTGGAGFVGSHLVEELVSRGHRVVSLDNYFSGSEANHVAGATYLAGDTRDIFRHITHTPDIIYHLGEYSRVEQSVLEPERVRDFNIAGTRAVVDFWREKRCKLVYAGSSTKFGDKGAARFTSPYAETKAANTELIRDVGERERLPYVIAYFYNVYGPREASGVYGTVIEHFKRMYVSGAPCAVVSPGTQERNFTHVSDIVDGLVRAGSYGHGDGYGIGNRTAYSILEVARMFGFGSDIVMFPPRSGNRMTADLDTSKVAALGWRARRGLPEYIRAFTSARPRGKRKPRRVLVLSATIHPVAGVAENAFVELARSLPDVRFDVVAAKFSRRAKREEALPPNMFIYRVGSGFSFDKYLFPVFGALKSLSLVKKNDYLFAWSLLASYGALAGVLLKYARKTPLLVTRADQDFSNLSFARKKIVSYIFKKADGVHGAAARRGEGAARVFGGSRGGGGFAGSDSFANALRYAYADIVRKRSGV